MAAKKKAVFEPTKRKFWVVMPDYEVGSSELDGRIFLTPEEAVAEAQQDATFGYYSYVAAVTHYIRATTGSPSVTTTKLS